MSITRLFYKSIYKSDDTYSMTGELAQLLEKHRKEVYDNVSNVTSKDTYVLNDPLCLEFKAWLHRHLATFFYDFYKIDKKVKMFITQSWINFTENGEFHHVHNHPNSVLSGVFYFTGENIKLKFSNDTDLFKGLQLPITEYTNDNSDGYEINLNPGQLVMFPSHLTHEVPKFEGTLRVSLAFNTFIKGDIGSLEGLTRVEI